MFGGDVKLILALATSAMALLAGMATGNASQDESQASDELRHGLLDSFGERLSCSVDEPILEYEAFIDQDGPDRIRNHSVRDAVLEHLAIKHFDNALDQEEPLGASRWHADESLELSSDTFRGVDTDALAVPRDARSRVRMSVDLTSAEHPWGRGGFVEVVRGPTGWVVQRSAVCGSHGYGSENPTGESANEFDKAGSD